MTHWRQLFRAEEYHCYLLSNMQRLGSKNSAITPLSSRYKNFQMRFLVCFCKPLPCIPEAVQIGSGIVYNICRLARIIF